ncbi:MAG: diguanylate cyclase [Myxococcales bacterium]
MSSRPPAAPFLPEPPQLRRPPGAHELTGRKILIVDDDRANIPLIRDGLAASGYRFCEAYDGAGALARIRDEKPDLIVMDIEMPGLGGVEVCRIVKANAGDGGFGFIPVILMTARGGTSKVEGLELGADDYLTKPFDMLELSARVKSMLRLKALNDELTSKYRELDRMHKDLEKKNAELEWLSRTDPLTGLFNRRFFEERFTAEFSRSKRYRVPLTCTMLDIDHFKKLNDTLGHQAGDAALREVSAVIRRTLREVDQVARYGGEEIVAIMPETGLQQGRQVAERLREEIAALKLEHRGKPFGVTVSVGLATFPLPGIDDHEALLRAADDALYKAKAAGRNRVHWFEE